MKKLAVFFVLLSTQAFAISGKVYKVSGQFQVECAGVSDFSVTDHIEITFYPSYKVASCDAGMHNDSHVAGCTVSGQTISIYASIPQRYDNNKVVDISEVSDGAYIGFLVSDGEYRPTSTVRTGERKVTPTGTRKKD